MGTEEEEEPPFDSVKTPNIVTIVLMVITFITHGIQYRAAGDWSGREFFFLQVAIIVWGFVLPAGILVLSFIGKKIYQDNEYITLIFGIIFTILSSALTVLATFWTIQNIIDLVKNIDYGVTVIVCYVVITACIAATLAMQIKSLIGGVQLIKYYQANKYL